MVIPERRRLLLGPNEVILVPGRFQRRRRQAVSIPYRDIVAIEHVAPEPGKQAALVLRTQDGDAFVVTYPRRAELRMRSVRHQLQKRVRAARRSD